MDFPIKETLKKLLNKGAARTVENMIAGAFVLIFANILIQKHDDKIVTNVTTVINKGDSVTQAKIKEVGENSNYNTILTIERVSNLEDTIYHDNKALRKENQRLQNERFKLLQEKSLMMNDVKKKFNPIQLYCLTPQ